MKPDPGLPLFSEANMIEATQDTRAFVQLSGVLKRIAAKLSKTCNDLRLLSSGPQAGFGEINLPARAAGTSIIRGTYELVLEHGLLDEAQLADILRPEILTQPRRTKPLRPPE